MEPYSSTFVKEIEMGVLKPRASPGISAGGAGVRTDHEDRRHWSRIPQRWAVEFAVPRRCSVVWDFFLTDGQPRMRGLSPPGGDSSVLIMSLGRECGRTAERVTLYLSEGKTCKQR